MSLDRLRDADRRTVLATAGLSITGALAGCFGGGDESSGGTEELSVDKNDTVVSADEGINGWIRSVEHNPAEQTSTVVAAIEVSTEQEYRIRLGVIDANGVTLAERIDTKILYDVGIGTFRAEFEDVPDCDECRSGLLHVSYPEGENPHETDEDGSEQAPDPTNENQSEAPPEPANESGNESEDGS